MSYAGFVTSVLSPGNSPAAEEVNWLEQEFPDPADQRAYAQQRCIVAVTEALGEAMSRAGINRAELAQKLGVSKGYVSQMFSERNLTLKSVADVLWACKLELRDLEMEPLGILTVPVDQALEWRNACVSTASGVRKGSIEVTIQGDVAYSPLERAAVIAGESFSGEGFYFQAGSSANNNLALAA